MSISHTEIRVKGKAVSVPSAEIDGRTVLSTGKWLKLAAVRDEELIEGDSVQDPKSFVSRLMESGLDADIFTFAQKLKDATPRYAYRQEWDNLAVIPITSFSYWWEKRVESSVRRAVRKAAKLGLVVRPAEFDDEFVKGIVSINNETPMRQGRAFWHFQKSFEEVKQENSTYPERNVFLGAYYDDELVGFIRLITVNKDASIIQVLSKTRHFDKRPTNALIAKAVEICEQRGISYLTYCNYVYNDPESSLTEFKRRNGFEKVLVPRYYIPLTLKGKIALRLGIHHGLAALIPKPLFKQLLKIRSLWYARRSEVIGGTP
jgi:Acetyltransferase (GNAT) family